MTMGSEGMESVGKELPRFLVAIQRYEQFLQAKAEEGGDAEFFNDVMTACGGLTRDAQTYDFVCTNPDLADTEVRTLTGQALAMRLYQPDIPAEVKAIYEDLYGNDLLQYATSEGM